MSEHDNLQDADGDNLNATPLTTNQPEEVISSSEPQTETLKTELPSEEVTTDQEKVAEEVTEDQEKAAEEEVSSEEVAEQVTEDQEEVVEQEPTPKEKDPVVTYESLSLEALITEFESLLKTENIHSVRNSISEVKNKFVFK